MGRFKNLRYAAKDGITACDYLAEEGGRTVRIEQIGGDIRASARGDLAEFMSSVNKHYHKVGVGTGNDYLVIDVAGFSPEFVAATREFVNTHPLREGAKLIRIGFE